MVMTRAVDFAAATRKSCRIISLWGVGWTSIQSVSATKIALEDELHFNSYCCRILLLRGAAVI